MQLNLEQETDLLSLLILHEFCSQFKIKGKSTRLDYLTDPDNRFIDLKKYYFGE